MRLCETVHAHISISGGGGGGGGAKDFLGGVPLHSSGRLHGGLFILTLIEWEDRPGWAGLLSV